VVFPLLLSRDLTGNLPKLATMLSFHDGLCGLVVIVPGSRNRGPGCDSRRYQIFLVAVSLERGPILFVRVNEELLERKVAASV
jgi:hypothetical protein